MTIVVLNPFFISLELNDFDKDEIAE